MESAAAKAKRARINLRRPGCGRLVVRATKRGSSGPQVCGNAPTRTARPSGVAPRAHSRSPRAASRERQQRGIDARQNRPCAAAYARAPAGSFRSHRTYGPPDLQDGRFALLLGGALRLEPLHPPLDELALERAQVVDEELTDQVIHLMLHADGEKVVRGFEAVLLSVPAEKVDDDAAVTRHLFVLVGNREATLGIGEFALRSADDRVDEPEETFALLLRGFAFLRLLLDVDGDDVLMHADLRSGEADAVGLVHGLGHVVAQLADGGVHRADGLALFLQPGIRPDDDFSQRHSLSRS